jgi:hypothetical protein
VNILITAREILHNIYEVHPLLEAITLKDVDKLEKEFNRIVRSLDNIDSGKSLFDASRLFDAWIMELGHFMNDRLLGLSAGSVPKNLVFNRQNPTYQEAADLFNSISSMYIPPFIPGDIASKFLPERILQSVSLPIKYSSDWDYAYWAWRVGRGKHRQDLVSFGDICLETLRNILLRIGGSSYDYYAKTSLKVDGVSIIISKGESDYSKQDLERTIDKVKYFIQDAKQQLKNKGLSFLLNNLTIEIDLQTVTSDKAKYDVVKDCITIYRRSDNVQDLFHELGHRIWNTKFDSETQDFWLSFIQSSLSGLDSSELDTLYKVFLRAWDTTKPNQSIYPAMEKILRKKKSNLSVKFGLLFFVARDIDLADIIKDPFWSEEEIQSAWAYLENVLTSFVYLPSSDFSSYANVSPKEAWSETFKLFISGDSLSDETTEQIEFLLSRDGHQPVSGFWDKVSDAVKNFLGLGMPKFARSA